MTHYTEYDYELEPTPFTYKVAEKYGINPVTLDWHVEAVHGWEKHNAGYERAVVVAARCIRRGGCA